MPRFGSAIEAPAPAVIFRQVRGHAADHRLVKPLGPSRRNVLAQPADTAGDARHRVLIFVVGRRNAERGPDGQWARGTTRGSCPSRFSSRHSMSLRDRAERYHVLELIRRESPRPNGPRASSPAADRRPSKQTRNRTATSMRTGRKPCSARSSPGNLSRTGMPMKPPSCRYVQP